MKDSGWPMKLYFFWHEGKYDPREVITIESDEHLKAPMIQSLIVGAVKNKFEVRLVDKDDYCTFHALDGAIVFPKTTNT